MKRLVIITIVLVMLLISSCGVNQSTIAGRINGEPIPLDQYVVAHRGHYENFSISHNRSPGIDEKQEIARETWHNITKHVILQQNFRRYKITSSVAEAIDTLKNNPPSYILKSPIFMVNGRFDNALYQQSLLYNKPEDLSPVVSQYVNYYVPVAKLKNALIDKELLSSKERKLYANVLKSEVEMDLITLDVNAINAAVKDEEMRMYYEEHKQDYLLNPHYSIAYAFLPLAPSRGDVAATNLMADSLYQSLTVGDKPEDAIAAALKVNPLIRIQESGFVKLDELDRQLAEDFATLAPGEYLPPQIVAGEGLRIHRLEQRTKSLINYSTIYIPYQPREQTIARDVDNALQAAKLLTSMGHQVASEELDLTFSPVSNIAIGKAWMEDGFVTPDVKNPQDIKKGWVPDPVFYAPQSGWLLLEVTQSQTELYQPFSEVRGEIHEHLQQQNNREFAYRDALLWLRSDAASNLDISELKGASYNKLKALSVDKNDPLVPDNVLSDAIVRRLKGQAATVYPMGDYVYIPLISRIQQNKDRKVEAGQVRELFIQNLPANWFELWMEEQVRQAKVTIYNQM